MALTSGTHLGPYEILEPLGAGGMGEVYRARDPRLGRHVALKVLPRELAASADRLERFRREAQSAASLSHPNIIDIFDFDDDGEQFFLVMEWLERIAPRVASITAVDTSPAMNEQLASKRDALDCALEILAIDLLATDLDRCFNGIISSMTIHHIADIPALFRRFHALLEEGGFIAIADLDTEDGSFHDDSTGVFHQGFDRQALKRVVSDAGFTRVDIATASVVREARGDYPVFLLTAFS